MKEAGHISGGAPTFRRFPVRASVVNPGVIVISVTDNVGVGPCTTTSFADTVGLGLEAVTYSTSQTAINDPAADLTVGSRLTVTGLDMGRVITVSTRPDLEISALLSGGATEGTALATLVNTSADTAGLTLTHANTQTTANREGIFWCLKGNNVGQARQIASGSSTTLVTTVPFPRTIAVGDTFAFVPSSTFGTGAGGIDGFTRVEPTTLLTQIDASIASGTGGEAAVTRYDLQGVNNSTGYFTLGLHVLNTWTG